jgi:DEAD/DEAH box helicase domain-containing protein
VTTSPTRAIDAAWRNVIALGADDGRLVTTAFEERRSAVSVPLPSDLPPALADGLRAAGIDRLFAHQSEALGEAAERHVIATSGTASGKSLSFNLPVLEGLARDPKRRALYIYPTKALAQDQARKLSELRLPFLAHAIYDGDTPREDRPGLRRRSNLILTNPDMLNMAMKSPQPLWCPTTRAGATSSPTSAGSSSTRLTPTAESSDPTSRTSCAVCAASPGSTDRSPGS